MSGTAALVFVVVVVAAVMVVVVVVGADVDEVVATRAGAGVGDIPGDRAACEGGTGPIMPDSETVEKANVATSAGPFGER